MKPALKKILPAIFFSFVALFSFSQERKISVLFNTQYTGTIDDVTKDNNPWAMGVGVQSYFNNNSRFRPTLDITADIYLEDDKVMRYYPDGTVMDDLGGVVSVFAGAAYFLGNRTYVSFVMGPGFTEGQTNFGIKPSFGFYFSERKRWTGKISYINLFNRDNRYGQDFTSISFTLGVRIY
jgi:hypothetical protein